MKGPARGAAQRHWRFAPLGIPVPFLKMLGWGLCGMFTYVECWGAVLEFKFCRRDRYLLWLSHGESSQNKKKVNEQQRILNFFTLVWT
jgi:hypothetical protein